MKRVILFCVFNAYGSICFSNKIDSAANEKNLLDSKIVEIEKENVKLKSEIERVDELNKTRFNDLYIWIGILVALITGGFVLITINANNVAKKQAIEELEKLGKILEGLQTKAIDVEAQLNEAKNKLEVFESLKNKENG